MVNNERRIRTKQTSLCDIIVQNYFSEGVKICKGEHALVVIMVRKSEVGTSSFESWHTTHVAGTEGKLVQWRGQPVGAVHTMRHRKLRSCGTNSN